MALSVPELVKVAVLPFGEEVVGVLPSVVRREILPVLGQETVAVIDVFEALLPGLITGAAAAPRSSGSLPSPTAAVEQA